MRVLDLTPHPHAGGSKEKCRSLETGEKRDNRAAQAGSCEISSQLARANEHVTAAEPETPQSNDYELGQKAAQGDMAAFEQLYQRHNRRVYSLCLRMTGNVSEAEDLAQEVFIQLFRKIGSFRGESAFTTWLHRLTVNQVLMHFRKRGVRMEQTTEDGETPVQIVKGTENPNSMPVVDRIALDKAIAQLPPGYRTVFTLHDIEGHEHEEIAKMLGCSVGTSKSQLHKARMKLRGLLRQQKEAE
ncbi:MAG TPA: RNA polymerase sigma factor [Pyrinomonadaceae bacterium]|nr:RNA polymerase sigma factor [Pyrinomonadaceae bacterium]